MALSLFHGRVADDWEERYGVRLAYSYVSAEHTGQSYRAAVCCREPDKGPRLRVYVKPLSADWSLGRAG